METFLNEFDRDIRQNLKQQLSALWTHSSNAIEGSSLTLGETDFVIREGITISGKPLKDFKDAESHYNAISHIYQLASSDTPLTKEILFLLHKAIMPNDIFDIYNPYGEWKVDPNGTYHIDNATNKSIWISYPAPEKIPVLMEKWFAMFNSVGIPEDKNSAIKAYSQIHTTFVAIHPFCSGNGRMARLIANIPVLRGGLPPIVIDFQRRKEYIEILAKIHEQTPDFSDLSLEYPQMEKFLDECYNETFSCIEQAREVQLKRNNEKTQCT